MSVHLKKQQKLEMLEGLSSALSIDPTPGELLADSSDDGSVEPIRRAWWMKHLSLLAVLQAACLAVGLVIHAEDLAGHIGPNLVPFLLTFAWVTLIQGGLGYLIFSRLYRTYLVQQEQIAETLRTQQSALSRTRDAVVLGLTRMAESRDDDTEGHLERVGILAARLSEAARARPDFQNCITPQFTRLIRFSATLHDIGKVGIEDSILQKPGSLTDDERERMQRPHSDQQLLPSGNRDVPGGCEFPADGSRSRSVSPRALGRFRISNGAFRRADSARGPHRLDRRRL